MEDFGNIDDTADSWAKPLRFKQRQVRRMRTACSRREGYGPGKRILGRKATASRTDCVLAIILP